MDSCDGIYQGTEMKRAVTSPRRKDIPDVLDALVASLQVRFADVDEGILEATRLVDVSSWPATKEEATGL